MAKKSPVDRALDQRNIKLIAYADSNNGIVTDIRFALIRPCGDEVFIKAVMEVTLARPEKRLQCMFGYDEQCNRSFAIWETKLLVGASGFGPMMYDMGMVMLHHLSNGKYYVIQDRAVVSDDAAKVREYYIVQRTTEMDLLPLDNFRKPLTKTLTDDYRTHNEQGGRHTEKGKPTLSTWKDWAIRFTDKSFKKYAPKVNKFSKAGEEWLRKNPDFEANMDGIMYSAGWLMYDLATGRRRKDRYLLSHISVENKYPFNLLLEGEKPRR